MTKEELANLLDSLNIQVNEGIQKDENSNIYPRIVYWEFVWDSLPASGDEYDTKVTYQISMFYQKPREQKLLGLKQKLNEKGLFPIINHEYVQEKREFHSYMAIDVLEKIDEEWL
jgi:hypothetical protein